MRCEMCGKEEDPMFKANIEGSELVVCSGCSSFGNIMKELQILTPKQELKIAEQEEAQAIQPRRKIVESIIQDYPKIIRKARENKGMDHKKFAAFLNEKISIVHKMETGNYTPDLKLAYKLEKLLNIELIEESADVEASFNSTKSDEGAGLTLGDMIKKRS